MLRRKRNKQVGERRVAAKRQKAQAKQQQKKASGSWLGFLKRSKGTPGTGALHASSMLHANIHSVSQSNLQLFVKAVVLIKKAWVTS